MVPPVDHVVVDVQNRIDEAARRYRALGFLLTERGRHSLGSVNHLAMFDSDYLELLGTGDEAGAVRPDLVGFPVGLNGLVFKLQGAEARYADLGKRGVPALPVQSFSRPLELDGRREEARFHTVRLEPRVAFAARVYFCEHLTPELVWRPEWREHPNGALALTRVVIAAQEPARVADLFERMFGPGAVAAGADGSPCLKAGPVAVEMRPHAALARSLGDALPDAQGRTDYMALLGVRVRALSQAERALRAGGVTGVRAAQGRLLVPPTEAMNVALEFSE